MSEKRDISAGETVVQREQKVLRFWKENKIFEKSEKGIAKEGFFGAIAKKIFGTRQFIFYDGPPFATGLPHYGHILVSAVKDAISRYKTMRGFSVRRRWGWDCHGLPLEVEMEKELGIRTKKDIEEYGIEKFNSKIREIIFTYVDEWKKIIPRIGRWVDMENDYRTVNTSYIESVWSVFHRLHKRGFVSKGFKSLHLCPRCSTTVSNTEVSDSYEMLKDTAVFVLFPLKDDPKVFLVAWTTTPWTLFGNVALGIDRDMEYTIIEKDGKRYVVHQNAAHHIEGGVAVGKSKGSEFEGKEYLPPFAHLYADEQDENILSKIWRVYSVPYVNTEVGTGIVHLAPAYGAQDMETAESIGLPIRHHISKDGVFIEKISGFAGLRPKEKGGAKEVDEKITTALDESGNLLKQEEVEHSYPVCWRCKTPLLNYATDSWFVHAEKFREKMVSENKMIKWVPRHIRDGRFGNWLSGAQEWAVSRSRFWGAPLPVWEVEKTGEHIYVNSLEEMFKKMRMKNKYIVIRHGNAVSNEKQVFDCREDAGDGLTEEGKEQAKQTAIKMKEQKPDVIFCSPFARTRETAEIIAKETGSEVIVHPLLSEMQIPEVHGRPLAELYSAVRSANGFTNIDAKIANGESYLDVYLRALDFLEEMDKKYENKTILIVTHKVLVATMKSIAPTEDRFKEMFVQNMFSVVPKASAHRVEYKSVQRTERGEVDVHRPYIDDVVLHDDDGNPAHHIGEVFDCWFESGTMPYGSHHYPFRNRDVFDPDRRRGFPADFICEGLDQTRGWFYSLTAIAVGAFGKTPYKRVIVTGLICAADGKKMSKSLKNYTDPMNVVEKYGADALRHYLLGSPVVRGEDLDFKDQQIDEIYKKVYVRLHNCLNFYTIYANLPHKKGSKGPLDVYILSRLAETRNAMTKGFESYRLDEVVAPIGQFVDDLSVWFVRRSRDRMRYDTEDGAYARGTLHFVLIEFAKCIAPVAPFYAEHLFSQIRRYHLGSVFLPESVHLCPWVGEMPINKGVIREMDAVRVAVSLAHEQRSRAGIKVRQPLGRVVVQTRMSKYAETLLADEINVKEVVFDADLKEPVVLDTEITPSLKVEGFVREYIRGVQNIRKEKKFSLTEKLEAMAVCIPEEQREHIRKFEEKIKIDTRVENIYYEASPPESADSFEVDDVSVSVALTKKPEKIFS